MIAYPYKCVDTTHHDIIMPNMTSSMPNMTSCMPTYRASFIPLIITVIMICKLTVHHSQSVYKACVIILVYLIINNHHAISVCYLWYATFMVEELPGLPAQFSVLYNAWGYTCNLAYKLNWIRVKILICDCSCREATGWILVSTTSEVCHLCDNDNK